MDYKKLYEQTLEENKELKEINERDHDYCDEERSPIGISLEEKDKIILSLVGEKFPELEKQVAELKKENKELKDFSNWENHPALKYKVVLDEDYYLALEEQLKQKDEWFEEISEILGVDKDEPVVEMVRDYVDNHKKE